MVGIKAACHHGHRRRLLGEANGSTPQARRMYGMATNDAVRPSADQHFRRGIAEYPRVTYADGAGLCILSRVIIEDGKALTVDWMLPRTRLFERSSL